MILSLHAQAQLFLLTILLGGGMGLVYDGLRVFRHVLPQVLLGAAGGWSVLAGGGVSGVWDNAACQQRRDPFFLHLRALRRYGSVFSGPEPFCHGCQRPYPAADEICDSAVFSDRFYAYSPDFSALSETPAKN